LVATGKADKGIATEPMIAVGTVDTHVEHILPKARPHFSHPDFPRFTVPARPTATSESHRG
jgi:hypothetical protein